MRDLAQDTKDYVKWSLENGMVAVTSRALKEMLGVLGYKLKHEFCYVNGMNYPHRWSASAKGIIDTRTGLSFANINANRDKLEDLQDIRRSHLVFENGRVWEI